MLVSADEGCGLNRCDIWARAVELAIAVAAESGRKSREEVL
jgi:hypothetical protein